MYPLHFLWWEGDKKIKLVVYAPEQINLIKISKQ